MQGKVQLTGVWLTSCKLFILHTRDTGHSQAKLAELTLKHACLIHSDWPPKCAHAWSSFSHTLQVLTVVDKDLSGRLTMQQVMGVQYVPLTRPTEMEDEMETWGPVPSQVPGKDEI